MKINTTCSWCCERFPWYVNHHCSPEEYRQVHEHLITCADCQRELALWQTITATLEATDHELPPDRAEADTWLALRERLPRNRLVKELHLKDKADNLMEYNVSDSKPSNHTNYTSTRQRPQSAVQKRPRALAVSAAALVIAASVLLFGVFGQQLLHNRVATVVHPTATAEPTTPCTAYQLQAHLPSYGYIASISMTSARDGWAVGDVWHVTTTPGSTSQPTITHTLAMHTLIMHLQNCQWTPVTDNIPFAALTEVSMVSSTEGWATGFTEKLDPSTPASFGDMFTTPDLIVLHYSHGHWQQEHLPQSIPYLYVDMHMTAHNGGWILVTTVDSQISNWASTLLHYQHGTWSIQPLPVTDPGTYDYYEALTVTPDGACWLAGFFATGVDNSGIENSSGSYGGTVSSAIMTTYQQGQWHTWKNIFPDNSVGFLAMTAIANNNIYAVGYHNSNQSTPVVEHYDGTAWTQEKVPSAPTKLSMLLAYSIVAFSPTDIWAFVLANDPKAPNTSLLVLHYDGRKWQWVSSPPSITGHSPLYYRPSTTLSTSVGWDWDNSTSASSQDVVSPSLHYSFIYYYNGAWLDIGDSQ